MSVHIYIDSTLIYIYIYICIYIYTYVYIYMYNCIQDYTMFASLSEYSRNMWLPKAESAQAQAKALAEAEAQAKASPTLW